MEKRIKSLYIITIIAILAFLGMQVYWLYQRYEYSVKEFEEEAYNETLKAFSEYREERISRSYSKNGSNTSTSQYRIVSDIDSIGGTRFKASVTTQRYSAHDLLGIKDKKRILTPEEQSKVARMVLEKEGISEQEKTFDTEGSPSESAIWTAFKNLDLDSLAPLKMEEWDSLMNARGISQEAKLVTRDSIEWQPSILSHATALKPMVSISIPYSELTKKSLIVECRFPATEVLRKMLGSLIVVTILSLFLIICLILQFATVLKLSRIDKMRNSFITTMIHELKRPISTLKMCVSGIENDRMIEDKDMKKELVKETRGALDNLSAYFSKLRDMTFNNVEQIPLNLTNINLREIFDNVSRGAVIPTGKKVTFINEICKDVEVPADYSHLFNILTNLIENAIKYSGNSVSIEASTEISSEGVRLHIKDTGFGIPAGDLKYIFNRFYRGKMASSDLPGIGLGLAYVKLLVEAHHGEITVKSDEGKGSCFTIKLLC